MPFSGTNENFNSCSHTKFNSPSCIFSCASARTEIRTKHNWYFHFTNPKKKINNNNNNACTSNSREKTDEGSVLQSLSNNTAEVCKDI